MMKFSRTMGTVGLLVLAGTMGPALSEQPKKADRLADLMQKKLHNSQKLLEGLALADFKLIGKHAEELVTLSKKVEWKLIETPRYELFRSDFGRIAENIGKNAKEKNIDGAGLNYLELTLICMNCHKHVREVRMTGLEQPRVVVTP